MTDIATRSSDDEKPFRGFEPITGNYVYCPNQFFDVCLPNCSRGVVRIVGYVLRQTLGFVDRRGQPIAETFELPHSQLIAEAGVGHDAIRESIDAAIEAGFLVCRQNPRPNIRHQPSQSGCYGLRWADHDQPYTIDPKNFSGFFSGEGNRTPIPNAFFDRVLNHERLAVVKVVGSILRHTVGYHTKFGRRAEAPLSYSYLQRYANIRSRATLSDAIQHATEADYILCVQPGSVGPKVDQRRAATYAVKWLGADKSDACSPESEPADHSENRTSETIRKTNQQHSDKRTRSTPKNKPAKHSENCTTERTLANDKLKQHHKEADADESVVAGLVREYHRLRFGVGECKPKPHELKHAVELLTTNSIAALTELLPEVVRLVEQNYGGEDLYFGAAVPYFAVAARKYRQTEQTRSAVQQNGPNLQAVIDVETTERERRRVRRDELLARWRKLPADEQRQLRQQAIDQAQSDTVRRTLLRQHDLDSPASEVLEAMDITPEPSR